MAGPNSGALVSKISDLKARIHALGDIKSILSAMKNLSVIEMNKISRFLLAQQDLARAVEKALGDFESFFPTTPASSDGLLCILIGSERGFCGAFNETILERLEIEVRGKDSVQVFVVGHKLATRVEGDPRVVGTIDGANSAEEIPKVISELSEQLVHHSKKRWMFIHNGGGEGRLESEVTFPLEHASGSRNSHFAYPPLLSQEPEALYPQLLEQYLSSILYRIFYVSFMAENRERLRHMDGALRKIEKDWNQLVLRLNASRQEEITEELEVIMLSIEGGK